MNQAIQLISVNSETKKLQVCEDAEKIIKSFDSKNFAVIVVVGKYRTGKSYLVNQVLLNQKQGFEVGSTINACTKGLWMWPKLVSFESQKSAETMPVLVIDTEGIGSVEEDQNHDVKVFLLAMLLSSFFIYNSIGTIDDQALQNLGLIVNLTKLLQKGDLSAQKDLFATFPQFLWILRDFTLRLEDGLGQKISSKEYLESALKPLKGISEAIENKNKIRRHITQFFQERDCVTLVRPTENEKDLQNLNKVNFSELREEFQQQVLLLKKKLYYKISLKKYKGKPVTPFTFIEMCKYFVEAINEGNLPVIENQWQMIQHKEFENHLKQQEMSYQEEMNKLLISEEISKEELDEYHKILVKKIKAFLSQNSEQAIFQSKWKQFKLQLNSYYEDIQTKLKHIQEDQLELLKENFIEEIQQYDKSDFWGIVDIAHDAVIKFQEKKAPQGELMNFVSGIWEQTILKIQNEFRLIQKVSTIHAENQKNQEIEIQELKEQLKQIQNQHDYQQQSVVVECKRLKIEIDQLSQQNIELERALNKSEELLLIKETHYQTGLLQLKEQQKEETDKLKQYAEQLQDRLVKCNIQIDRFQQLHSQQEKTHKNERQSLQMEIDKWQQLYRDSPRNSMDCNMTISVNGDKNLEEWRHQKEYLQKQLQEAYREIQQQKQQNDDIINSLRY